MDLLAKRFRKCLPFIAIFAVVLILYHPVLSTYFSHDDFFHFKVSNPANKPGGYLYFLGFHPFSERGIAFYRPLFREFLYGPLYSLFGLNQIPFRVLSLTLHMTNIYLLYNLLQKVFKKTSISYMAAFFFGISASNVVTLYYLAGGIQTMGATTFLLLSLISFWKYIIENSQSHKYYSFIFFLLALSSHEQAVITPILLSLILLIKYKYKDFIVKVFSLWPYFLVTALYVYLNITAIGYSESEAQYQISFNIKSILNSYMWYTGWAFGLPEMLIDFVPPGFRLDPRLMRYWGDSFRIIFPAFFASITLISMFTIKLIKNNKKIFFNKKLTLFLIWFPLGLITVIFLPSHKSNHYLYISLPAFWTLISYIVISLHKHTSKILFGVLIVSLFVLNTTSAILENETYWAAARGRLAGKIVHQLKKQYPTLPKGATLYFENHPDYPYVAEDWGGTSKQASFALNDQDALQLLYKDPTLKVLYKDIDSLPEGKVYKLVAPIP
jgi:hypothetical protein